MATATASDTEKLTTAESDAAVGVDDTHVDIVPILKQATAGKALRFLGVYALTRPRGWTDAQLDALRRTCESSPSPSISTSTASSTTGFAFEDAASQSSFVSSLYAGAPSASRDNRVKAASSGHDKAIEITRSIDSAASHSTESRNPLFAAFQANSTEISRKRKRQTSQTPVDEDAAPRHLLPQVTLTECSPNHGSYKSSHSAARTVAATSQIVDLTSTSNRIDESALDSDGSTHSSTASEVDYRDAAHLQVKAELQRIKRQLKRDYKREQRDLTNSAASPRRNHSSAHLPVSSKSQTHSVANASMAVSAAAFEQVIQVPSALRRVPPPRIEVTSDESYSDSDSDNNTQLKESQQSTQPEITDVKSTAAPHNGSVRARGRPPHSALIKRTSRAAQPSSNCHSCESQVSGMLSCMLCRQRLCRKCLQFSYSSVAAYTAIIAYTTTAKIALQGEGQADAEAVLGERSRAQDFDMSALDFACPKCKRICKCDNCTAVPLAPRARVPAAAVATKKRPLDTHNTKQSRLEREAAIFTGYNASCDLTAKAEGRRKPLRRLQKPSLVTPGIRMRQRPSSLLSSFTDDKQSVRVTSTSRQAAAAGRRRFRIHRSSSSQFDDPLIAAEARRRAIDEQTEHTPHVSSRLPAHLLQSEHERSAYNPRANAVPRLGSPPYEMSAEDGPSESSTCAVSPAMPTDVDIDESADIAPHGATREPQFSMPQFSPTRVLMGVQMGAKLGSRRFLRGIDDMLMPASAGDDPDRIMDMTAFSDSGRGSSNNMQSAPRNPDCAVDYDLGIGVNDISDNIALQPDIPAQPLTLVQAFEDLDNMMQFCGSQACTTDETQLETPDSALPDMAGGIDGQHVFERYTGSDFLNYAHRPPSGPSSSHSDILNKQSIGPQADMSSWKQHHDPLLANEGMIDETSLFSLVHLPNNNPVYLFDRL